MIADINRIITQHFWWLWLIYRLSGSICFYNMIERRDFPSSIIYFHPQMKWKSMKTHFFSHNEMFNPEMIWHSRWTFKTFYWNETYPVYIWRQDINIFTSLSCAANVGNTDSVVDLQFYEASNCLIKVNYEKTWNDIRLCSCYWTHTDLILP